MENQILDIINLKTIISVVIFNLFQPHHQIMDIINLKTIIRVVIFNLFRPHHQIMDIINFYNNFCVNF